MKRTLLYIIAALAVLAFGFGTSSALADQPPAPPGQDPCSHGNTGKPCRPDPSPNGKDCDHHGNNGGVNEDHCQGETTPPPPCSVNCGPPCSVNCNPPPPCKVNCGPPPPCTVNCGPPPPCTVNCGGPPPCKVNCGGDTTTTQTTTTQTATPTPPVVPPAVTPPKAKPPVTKPPKAKPPKAKQPVTKTKLETALRKQAKPSTPSSEPQATGVLPNTGLPLFPLALLGGGLTGLGGWLRRRFG